jgi:hypothetical protein
MKLTIHQKRVLAAMLALARQRGERFWSRDSIGQVVGSSGYHAIIQRKTMAALKALGLVQTERSAWPASVAAAVRCPCACCFWGLTAAGTALAETLPVRMSEASLVAVANCRDYWDYMLHDEDEPPAGREEFYDRKGWR